MTSPLSSPVPHRPTLQTSNSSYSKRHASLDSPREIPLPPSPSLQRRISANTAPYSLGVKGKGVDPLSSIATSEELPEHGTDDSSDTSSYSLPSASSAPTSPLSTHPSDLGSITDPTMITLNDMPSDTPGVLPRVAPEISDATQAQASSSVFPFPRPYSLPDAQSTTMPVLNAVRPDRTSCASLPLPMQTPYFTLPKFPLLEEGKELNQIGRTDVSGVDWPKILDKTATQRPPFDQPSLSSSSPTAIRPASSILSSSSSLSQSSGSYPPPTPPTILAPSPPPMAVSGTTRTQAPYEPFLCHAPPPEDSWIAVETTQTEYTLVVRLPGFKRDGM